MVACARDAAARGWAQPRRARRGRLCPSNHAEVRGRFQCPPDKDSARGPQLRRSSRGRGLDVEQEELDVWVIGPCVCRCSQMKTTVALLAAMLATASAFAPGALPGSMALRSSKSAASSLKMGSFEITDSTPFKLSIAPVGAFGFAGWVRTLRVSSFQCSRTRRHGVLR